MDKRTVILAYRRGFITLRECAQVLGVDQKRMPDLLREVQRIESSGNVRRTSVNGL